MSARILLLEDDESLKRVLSHAMTASGHQVRATASPQAALNWIREGQGDLLLADVLLDGVNFLDELALIKRLQPDLPVIIMSAQTTASTAIDAEKGGVFEYLPKPFDLDVLANTIELALGRKKKVLAKQEKSEPSGLIGQSAAIQKAFKALGRAAMSQAHVLIVGEPGVGKRQAAEALFKSTGVSPDFVKIISASHSPEVIFETAQSNTQLLWLRLENWNDEQQKAARNALDTTSARIVATSTSFSGNNISSSLRTRLEECVITVPPLRDRVDDIEALSELFLRQVADRDGKSPIRLEPEALARLKHHKWSENLTGLRSCISRLSLNLRGDRAKGKDIDAALEQSADTNVKSADKLNEQYAEQTLSSGFTRQSAIDDLDRALIAAALGKHSGNRTKVAQVLGINRNTLARRISELKLDL